MKGGGTEWLQKIEKSWPPSWIDVVEQLVASSSSHLSLVNRDGSYRLGAKQTSQVGRQRIGQPSAAATLMASDSVCCSLQPVHLFGSGPLAVVSSPSEAGRPPPSPDKWLAPTTVRRWTHLACTAPMSYRLVAGSGADCKLRKRAQSIVVDGVWPAGANGRAGNHCQCRAERHVSLS